MFYNCIFISFPFPCRSGLLAALYRHAWDGWLQRYTRTLRSAHTPLILNSHSSSPLLLSAFTCVIVTVAIFKLTMYLSAHLWDSPPWHRTGGDSDVMMVWCDHVIQSMYVSERISEWVTQEPSFFTNVTYFFMLWLLLWLLLPSSSFSSHLPRWLYFVVTTKLTTLQTHYFRQPRPDYIGFETS